jgi:hypothetical protein
MRRRRGQDRVFAQRRRIYEARASQRPRQGEPRFRHDDAQAFKDAILGLILAPAEATVASQEAVPDIAEQIKSWPIFETKASSVRTSFSKSKVELLAKM